VKYILAHPTLIMQLATLVDHTVHTGMVKLGEALVLMLGGI